MRFVPRITFLTFLTFFTFAICFFYFPAENITFAMCFFTFHEVCLFFTCVFLLFFMFCSTFACVFLLSGKQTPGPLPTRTTRHINYAPSVSACCKFTNSTQSQRGRESEGSHSERNISISTGMLLLPSLSFRVKQYACVGSGPTSLCCASWFWARCLKVHPCGRGNSTISDA